MKTEEEFKKEFGEKLSRIRKQSNLTQLQLAEALNYSDKAVSKWERGESLPDTYTLIRIAQVLGVDPSCFLQDEVETIKLKRRHPTAYFVPAISSVGILFIASVMFLVLKLTPVTAIYAPYIYLLALPIMFIELVVFSFIWWKNPARLVVLSCLIWSVGGVAYGLVQLLTDLYDFKYIFICCAILQAICIITFIFVGFIKRQKKHNR